MVQLNDRKYEDWEEYIRAKFARADFIITEDGDTSSINIITVFCTTLKSKTKIIFDFPTGGLCRACFYHPESPLVNAHNQKERLRSLMYSDFELNVENLQAMEKYLDIPLYFGWTEKTIFFKEELIKSELLYFNGTASQTILLESNLSWFDKASCLVILFAWPIFVFQYILVRQRLNPNNRNTTIRQVNIPPMMENRNTNR